MTIANHKLALTLGIGLAATAGGLAGVLTQGEGTSPALSAAPVEQEVAPEPGPMVGSYVPLSEAFPQSATTGEIIYPDGNNFPALNGVQVSVDLIWPNRPYAPIVGTARDGPPNYLEWYVHSNGVSSTTTMMQNRRGGPLEPTGLVRTPIAPMHPSRVLWGKTLQTDKDKTGKTGK